MNRAVMRTYGQDKLHDYFRMTPNKNFANYNARTLPWQRPNGEKKERKSYSCKKFNQRKIEE
jgi:hypothetical protein